jgi:phenylacetate-coenzyme A ligase PaaK-like adenylate-forming protein
VEIGRGGLSRSVRNVAVDAALALIDVGKQLAIRNYPLFELAARTPIPPLVYPLGSRAALRAAFHAHRRVPAYRDFADRHRWTDDASLPGDQRVARLPITDKKSYILAYPTAERCLDGRLKLRGTEMDESSGSSGKPYNWVRGAAELNEMHWQFSQYARYLFRDDVVTINAFSMGAWSSGVNMARSMQRSGLVKSIGPDLEKIVDTLRVLGPAYPYVITGYPPFLREILEHSDAQSLDLRPYRLYGIVGGEAISEQLRDRLLTRFSAIYSAYGASDLDIGVSAETPLSIWVRRQAAAVPELRQLLFGHDPRLPMLFQYNPLDHNIEVVNGELVITVCRLSMLSPRIRYNIHDAGGAYSFEQVVGACRMFGLEPPMAGPDGRPPFRLPFMYVHGRSDSTVSYMGANIYPEDIEQALFSDSALAERIGAFALELRDIGNGAARPWVHVELQGGTSDGDGHIRDTLRRAVVARLEQNSRDFRAAVQESPTTAEIGIELHEPGTGPFAENSRRIKRRYIIPSQQVASDPAAGERSP